MKTTSLKNLPFETKVTTILRLIKQVKNDRTTGFSINLDMKQPVDGYMVGGSIGHAVCYSDYEEFVRKHLELCTGSVYIGAWKYIKDGNVYLELSDRYENRDDAASIARIREEVCFYDVKNKCDIKN